MIDKKVMVFATGGTIAMKYDPAKHGLVPACNSFSFPILLLRA